MHESTKMSQQKNTIKKFIFSNAHAANYKASDNGINYACAKYII